MPLPSMRLSKISCLAFSERGRMSQRKGSGCLSEGQTTPQEANETSAPGYSRHSPRMQYRIRSDFGTILIASLANVQGGDNPGDN